jgi:uncharacterized protein (DUF488 family)
MAPAFFTIGHSTRSVAKLAGLLQEAGAGFVVDVRAFPRSRTNPQFNFDVLPACQSALNSFQVTACKSFHFVSLISAASYAV